MTQPSHANPHRIFWHCFSRLSETLRKPLETQGNPHSCSGNPEVTPLNAFTHPLRPYKAFTLHRAFRFWAQTPRRLHSIGRRQHTTPEHTFRARQLDACAEDVMPPGTQDPLATLTTPYKSTPVGFEPTRGDPDALAARPKCPLQNLQVSCIPVQAVMSLSASASCAPLTSPSHPLSPTHENSAHQPGIEPGSDGKDVFYH